VVSGADLDKLDREHRAYVKANPQISVRAPRGRSFRTWYLMGNRPKWKVGCYYLASVTLAKKARRVLENEHGAHDFYDIMGAAEGEFEENDWVLCFNVEGKVAKWAEWMFAHHVIKVPRSDKRAYASDAPCQVIQVFRTAAYSQPPFAVDAKFRRALRNTVEDLGGLDGIERIVPARPTRTFVDGLYRHYT
jgi:hypothetical protein